MIFNIDELVKSRKSPQRRRDRRGIYLNIKISLRTPRLCGETKLDPGPRTY